MYDDRSTTLEKDSRSSMGSSSFRYFWRPAMEALRKGRTEEGLLQISFEEFLRYVVKDQQRSEGEVAQQGFLKGLEEIPTSGYSP